MRTIKQTATFKRDLKRVARGPHRRALQADFTKIGEILALDLQLPESYRDHALAGDWKDHRD